MIEVKNLTKKFGTHLAVDHLSFKVEKGQIYGFLGPNGAGKTTTMNMMTGYLGATEGEIIINGYNILKEPEKAKKCIGYLPELPPVYMDMTVLEYLEFAAELKKIKKELRKTQVNEIIERVKLSDVKDRLIKNLSKGYKQRVGLAQAILGYPEIIILDEPTVGLDPKQIIEIRELIRELAKEHTIILSSHILAEVSEVCDYVMIISKGKLAASDTPDNLENVMKGSETIRIQAKAEKSVTKEIVEQISGISKAEYENTADGITNVTIQTDRSRDIREDLFFGFAKQNIALLQMETSKVSLEDVFLELTSDEKAHSSEKKNKDSKEKSGNKEQAEAKSDKGEWNQEEPDEEAEEIKEEKGMEGTDYDSNL